MKDILYADVVLNYQDRIEIKDYPETLKFSYLFQDTICTVSSHNAYKNNSYR